MLSAMRRAGNVLMSSPHTFAGAQHTIIFLICQATSCSFHGPDMGACVVAHVGAIRYDLSLHEKIFRFSAGSGRDSRRVFAMIVRRIGFLCPVPSSGNSSNYLTADDRSVQSQVGSPKVLLRRTKVSFREKWISPDAGSLREMRRWKM